MDTSVAVWQNLMEVDAKRVRPFLYLQTVCFKSVPFCMRSVSVRPLWGFGCGILGKQVRRYNFFFFS